MSVKLHGAWNGRFGRGIAAKATGCGFQVEAENDMEFREAA